MKMTIPLVAEAKKHASKPKNKRSQMLRMVMPVLSHDLGEQLAEAIDKGDVGRMRGLWQKAGKEIEKKLEHKH